MSPLDSGRYPDTAGPIQNPDPSAFVSHKEQGGFDLNLLIGNLTCPGCIPKIEGAFQDCSDHVEARVSLSTKRLALHWENPNVNPKDLVEKLGLLGYVVAPLHADANKKEPNARDRALLRAMAVAGFAWANIMLLSVSVWAGAVSDMDATTRDWFHWISALIALPAIAYAGQPFFRSAARSLAGGHINMDVPISLAVLLAAGVSVWQAAESGPHAYFDAAVMLLFFLLLGRFLDERNRARTSMTAHNLLALQSNAGTVVNDDGSTRALPATDLRPGMIVRVLPGDRIPGDGIVERGRSDLDMSLVNGESDPQTVNSGDSVFAGTMALSGSLDIRITKKNDETFLSEIIHLIEAAEQSKSRYVKLADRATKFYAPAVHGAALLTFIGWWFLAGTAWDQALLNAVAVLIITCPCALGLAVPTVQVVTAGRLFQKGILLKSGDALERLAAFDTIVFDKTGTLTEGSPNLVNRDAYSEDDLRLAAALAGASRHPLARAIYAEVPDGRILPDVSEWPGLGLSANTDDGEVRLGSRSWCGVEDDLAVLHASDGCSEIWLRHADGTVVPFLFRDRLRSGAASTVNWARQQGFDVLMLSGDRRSAVSQVAEAIGIKTWYAEQTPQDKIAQIQALEAKGRSVLMVGDGLNDAPALAAAQVSLSPSTAADVSQTAADMVFLSDDLGVVAEVISSARTATRRVKENFALAAGYNVVALPIAMMGLVTPLIAALAMSTSSIIVTLNAMRGETKRNSS
jgi:Cu2+-exporting ATPase